MCYKPFSKKLKSWSLNKKDYILVNNKYIKLVVNNKQKSFKLNAKFPQCHHLQSFHLGNDHITSFPNLFA